MSHDEEIALFSTASGKTIDIKPEALQRARRILEDDENGTVPCSIASSPAAARRVEFRSPLASVTSSPRWNKSPPRTPFVAPSVAQRSVFRSPLPSVSLTPPISRTPTSAIKKFSKFRSPVVHRDVVVAAHMFGFPFPPYDIQKQLMEALIASIESGNVGIFESPTGTGKSLSTICAVLTWLKRFEANRREKLQSKIVKLKSDEKDAGQEIDTSTNWIDAYKVKLGAQKEREVLEEEAEALRKVDERLREAQEGSRRKKSFDGRKRKVDDDISDEDLFDVASPSNSEDADLLPGEEIEARNEDSEETDLACTKIFYASRTHSQLEQLLEEIRKTSFNPRVVQLASRQALCVNEDVRSLKNLNLMNERCMEMRKSSNASKAQKTDAEVVPTRSNRKKALCKCEYAKSDAIEDLADKILAADDSMTNIEKLASAGRGITACSYYATRKALGLCEIVLLPYPILLHEKTRRNWGVDVKGNVVVIDEAHNLLSTVADIHSVELTLPALTVGLSLVREYIDKYKERLNASNLGSIVKLQDIIATLEKNLKDNKETDKIYSMPALINELKLYNFDLFDILYYIDRTNLCSKFHGFFKRYCGRVSSQKKQEFEEKLTGIALLMKKREEAKNRTQEAPEEEDVPEEEKTQMSSPVYQIVTFIDSLTNKCEDARVLIKREDPSAGTPATYRFLLLNPADKLKDLVKEARSVLLIGGTMEPAEQLIDAFERVCEIPKDSIARFSCGHVVDDHQLTAVSLAKGPNGHDFTLNFANRSTPQTIAAIGMTFSNILRQIPNGVVAFFASYDYMAKFISTLKANGMYERINNSKPIFVEGRGASAKLWNDFSKQAKTPKGAMLCAVVGGKLSEGINFSDELGRCVFMIGLPYPNKNSVELQEKMKYLDRNVRPGAGSAHYEACCMHAVNQAIGRAIRHRDDYAAIVLLDARYAKLAIKDALPKWISSRLTHCEAFPSAMQKIVAFFKGRK
ncbi:hypothetical protein L596_024654 [Steinernema carpocapsae]|uniref:Helicase ATP-binding domain-containing protein n=1 Tax=Steinernema carpocapsae TaxID=34508 RepID=A0A4U5M5C7_STECR|nr:hypothetical protein L596_024654 [Steinernema carpocapsae]